MSAARGSGIPTVLVAIAFLILLYALLFPSVTVRPGDSRRTQAKNDVTQIATAVTAFETEYGHLPGANNMTIPKRVGVWNNPELGKPDRWFWQPAKLGRRGVTSWD